MYDDVTYVALNEDGTGVRRDRARMGKTDLQRRALRVTKSYLEQFESREQHKEFMKLEDMASPFDKTPAGVLQAGWYDHVLTDTEAYNRKAANRKMSSLIELMGNTEKRDAWLTPERRAALLKKPQLTPANIPTVVKGTKSLTYTTRRRVADEVDQVIANIERVLGVNVRRVVANLDNAKLIADHLTEHPEQTFDQWYEWFQTSQWRMDNKNVFANVGKVWESWPQAFVQGEGSNYVGEVGI